MFGTMVEVLYSYRYIGSLDATLMTRCPSFPNAITMQVAQPKPTQHSEKTSLPINLKPNNIPNLLRIPTNRHRRQNILKPFSPLLIIHNTSLHLFPLGQFLLQFPHRPIIRMFPLHSLLYVAVRGLKESTIAAHDLGGAIAG